MIKRPTRTRDTLGSPVNAHTQFEGPLDKWDSQNI
jgi:hypothetical protein